MITKNAKTTAPETATHKAATETGPSEPAGWEDRTRPNLDGWYSPERSGPIQGVLCGTFLVDGENGPRRVSCVRLDHAAPADMDKATVQLAKGQVIAVSERHGLAEMYEYDAGTKVWFKALEKKQLSGGKSVWSFKLLIAPGSKRLVQTPAQAAF